MVLKSDNAAGVALAFLGLRLRHRLDVSAEVLPLHKIFSIVSSGSPLALIASSLRSTSKKPLCFITRPSSLRQRGRCQRSAKVRTDFIGKDAKNRPARCCEEATMQTANPNASDHLPLPWLSVPPTPFAAEDEASAPGAPRALCPSAVCDRNHCCGWPLSLWPPVLLVLYSNLRSSAEVDPRALERRFRFCHDARLVRGRRRHVRSDPAVRSGRCRVRRFRGCSQPCASHIRDLAVVCKMDLFDTNGTLRVPLKHMFIAPSYRRTMA